MAMQLGSNDHLCDECFSHIDVGVQYVKDYCALRATRHFCGSACIVSFYRKMGFGHEDHGDMKGLRGG